LRPAALTEERPDEHSIRTIMHRIILCKLIMVLPGT
jgi:hypothetical protein